MVFTIHADSAGTTVGQAITGTTGSDTVFSSTLLLPGAVLASLSCTVPVVLHGSCRLWMALVVGVPVSEPTWLVQESAEPVSRGTAWLDVSADKT